MVDDIRGTCSSVSAIRERVFSDGRCTCGGGRATTGRGTDAGAEEATEHGVVCCRCSDSVRELMGEVCRRKGVGLQRDNTII